MPYWREHSSIACPQCQGGMSMAPRSVSEQTDAIMRHLAAAPSDLAVGSAQLSGPMGHLAWPEPLFDPGEEPPEWRSPASKGEPQSYQRVASPAMLLQLGARAWEALRTLGPAAAAALAAIIKSYQDRLGRPPSPSELDRALQDRISEPSREPKAAPIASPDAEFFKKPSRRDNEAACERQYAMETEQCNQTTKAFGKRAGALCHAAAMDRYAECLKYGFGRERTRLPIVPN